MRQTPHVVSYKPLTSRFASESPYVVCYWIQKFTADLNLIRLIRDLELRTQTGASIVGIERNGSNIINPGPEEELQPGDQVLLLGTPDQIQAATQLLG